jgi:hypothetical protein
MILAIRDVILLRATTGGDQTANETNGADPLTAGPDSFFSLYTSQDRGMDAVLSPRPDYLAHCMVYASWLAVIGLGETTARPIQP